MLLCLNVPVPVSTLYTYELHEYVIHPNIQTCETRL